MSAFFFVLQILCARARSPRYILGTFSSAYKTKKKDHYSSSVNLQSRDYANSLVGLNSNQARSDSLPTLQLNTEEIDGPVRRRLKDILKAIERFEKECFCVEREGNDRTTAQRIAAIFRFVVYNFGKKNKKKKERWYFRPECIRAFLGAIEIREHSSGYPNERSR